MRVSSKHDLFASPTPVQIMLVGLCFWTPCQVVGLFPFVVYICVPHPPDLLNRCSLPLFLRSRVLLRCAALSGTYLFGVALHVC